MRRPGSQRRTRSDKCGGQRVNSWSQFVAMGGYGLYVWGSFGMCIVVVAVEVGILAVRRRALRYDVDDLGVDTRDADL
jgi:heme exporter protein D